MLIANSQYVGEDVYDGEDDEEGRFFGGGLNKEQEVGISSLSHLLKEIYEEYVRNLTDDFSNPYSKFLIYLMQPAKANKVPLLIYQRSEGR